MEVCDGARIDLWCSPLHLLFPHLVPGSAHWFTASETMMKHTNGSLNPSLQTTEYLETQHILACLLLDTLCRKRFLGSCLVIMGVEQSILIISV